MKRFVRKSIINSAYNTTECKGSTNVPMILIQCCFRDYGNKLYFCRTLGISNVCCQDSWGMFGATFGGCLGSF